MRRAAHIGCRRPAMKSARNCVRFQSIMKKTAGLLPLRRSEMREPMTDVNTMQPRPVPVGPELTVVVPTFNEQGNVSILICRLASSLAGISLEVMFVDDDSP